METNEINVEIAGLSHDATEMRKQLIMLDRETRNNNEPQMVYKKEIVLPHTGKITTDTAIEIADAIKDKFEIFYRLESNDIVEINEIKDEIESEEKVYTGFKTLNPNRFITYIEKYIIPGIYIKDTENGGFKFKCKSMNSEVAKNILQSEIMHIKLPKIKRILSSPIPMIYKEQLTFPNLGYDPRFQSWLTKDSPTIKQMDMSLEDAKEVLRSIYSEFCFKDKQDEINAISALLTPFCRGLYSRFNTRTPLFFYIANRERCGKDYCAGITGLVHEGVALEECAISSEKKKNSEEELKKEILSAMIAGRKRLHFPNNKGYLDNVTLESALTSNNYSGRLLGKNELIVFDNEIDFSLSGNVGITFTADLGNRSQFINLFLDIEDANSRHFNNPDLHKWILDNREIILSALYSLVKNWFDKGCPSGKVNFASFPEWARVVGGIMETANYDSPCIRDKLMLELGGDVETNNMKALFELCCKNEMIMDKRDIKQLIKEEDEDIFGYLNFEDKSDQTIFGNILTKFENRILSDIKMIRVDTQSNSRRRRYQFVKQYTSST